VSCPSRVLHLEVRLCRAAGGSSGQPTRPHQASQIPHQTGTGSHTCASSPSPGWADRADLHRHCAT
jgi:hypothetical protein